MRANFPFPTPLKLESVPCFPILIFGHFEGILCYLLPC